MWYNSENYNRVIVTAANSIGHSTTNLIKTDILENIKEWFRTIYLQSHLRDIVLPNQESIPSELRGRSVTIQQYGDNIDILSLPDGNLIQDLTSFSEITTAYNVFSEETDDILLQLHALKKENERIKTLNNKIIIYTEGKTDVKYLKLAFEKLEGYEEIKSRVEYYDIEHAKNSGDGELAKIFDYLQKGNDSNIKICMFDRDNINYIFSETFLRGNNRVYKFNLLPPSHRNKNDLISVEHCLTDDALKTFDANGRRIFLSGEFGVTGISTDNQYLCHHKMGTNPLEILDGSNTKKVFRIDTQDTSNYALTKDDFVQHIINNDPGFDSFSFEGFRPTLDMIKTIVQDAEGN